MDRRTFLKGTAASAGAGRLALGGLGGGTGALTLARPARAQEADVHRFTFGEFEVTVLSDGAINLPVSALSAAMDEKLVVDLLAERGLPTDVRPGAVNVVLLSRGEERILIDTGSGLNFLETAGRLDDSLGNRRDRARFDQQGRHHPRASRPHLGHHRRFRGSPAFRQCRLRDFRGRIRFLAGRGADRRGSRQPQAVRAGSPAQPFRRGRAYRHGRRQP